MAHEFKVGDRVIRLKCPNGGKPRSFEVGEIGTVLGFYNRGGHTFVNVELQDGTINNGNSVGNLELVEEPVWEIPNSVIADEPISKQITPPILDMVQAIQCHIAKKSYPYASLDSNGELSFHSEPPASGNYFETAAVV